MCCAAAVVGYASVRSAVAFVSSPHSTGVAAANPSPPRHGLASATEATQGSGWGNAAAAVSAVAVGAHVGLAVAMRGRTARKAEAEAKPAAKPKEDKDAGPYKESAADARLFEMVYMDYTREYLKGPMYWHEEKLQGFLPQYPGEPMFKNGKITSNVVGNYKTFSSNELAFLSFLFFAIGLYGNLQFNFYDLQWAVVDAGGSFNVSYIVESLFLPFSFFMHIAAYIQKKNGK